MACNLFGLWGTSGYRSLKPLKIMDVSLLQTCRQGGIMGFYLGIFIFLDISPEGSKEVVLWRIWWSTNSIISWRVRNFFWWNKSWRGGIEIFWSPMMCLVQIYHPKIEGCLYIIQYFWWWCQFDQYISKVLILTGGR